MPALSIKKQRKLAECFYTAARLICTRGKPDKFDPDKPAKID
jgi:hypothetical protein